MGVQTMEHRCDVARMQEALARIPEVDAAGAARLVEELARAFEEAVLTKAPYAVEPPAITSAARHACIGVDHGTPAGDRGAVVLYVCDEGASLVCLGELGVDPVRRVTLTR